MMLFSAMRSQKIVHVAAEWALDGDRFQYPLGHLLECWTLTCVPLRCDEQRFCFIYILEQLDHERVANLAGRFMVKVIDLNRNFRATAFLILVASRAWSTILLHTS